MYKLTSPGVPDRYFTSYRDAIKVARLYKRYHLLLVC